MPLPLTIPADYPIVGLGYASMLILNMWQQVNCGKARKAAGIKYPTLYATEEEAKADPKKYIFNCTQRAHQNTIENVGYVVPLSLFFGLFHPKLATAFTLSWVVGRVGYTLGYMSGKPEKRTNPVSIAAYIGLFGLLFGTLNVSLRAGGAILKRDYGLF